MRFHSKREPLIDRQDVESTMLMLADIKAAVLRIAEIMEGEDEEEEEEED